MDGEVCQQAAGRDLPQPVGDADEAVEGRHGHRRIRSVVNGKGTAL
ncbi:hypothetical protein ACFQU2_19925 [Siccirubricoccus deserti]